MPLISIFISACIIILLILGMSKNSSRSYKSEMVSLGVLGTFVGIATGLWHFDVNNIEYSMPHLLTGLKTAFITSGIGIACSIFISIFKPNVRHKTIDDLYQNQLEMIEQLKNSLETIATKNTDEFGILLRDIVKDFNNNLTEQFGDNFKKLNSSVENMIVWQDNYKSQVQQYEDRLKNTITKIESLTKIREKEEDNIIKVMVELEKASNKVNDSMKESTDIVKENLQLLLREANGKLR